MHNAEIVLKINIGLETQSRKQQIYFLPMRKTYSEKIKELFLAIAQKKARMWKCVEIFFEFFLQYLKHQFDQT